MPQDMLELEMATASRSIVEQCLNVQTDEEVLVLTDPRTFGVGKSIATAANGVGADVVTSVMPLLESHGNEPLDTVADAMATADVAFTCTTHAITHTRARLRAAGEGTRIGVLRGVTEDMMVDGAMTVDFEALRRRTEAMAQIITDAEEAVVTSDQGTDVEFSIEGCQSFSLDGYFHEEYGFATLPPGEAPTHPAEGTANGTIVIDVAMDNLGHLEEPIELTLENGFVTDVQGGTQAEELEEIFEGADENARNLAEFAIGTNPKAKLIGNTAEDKKREGTIHFAVGDNESLGGTLKSDIHLDGVIKSPTVKLDGTTVVDDGALRRELLE
ncbi:thermophilic metalloprotease (M29) [Halalkalicoccus paucihalophilus]|uniref:Thermophilic metalloprotease (M29) n=1 Tax=Halalkalicoccus paucihalophilus TaxID=1008153 RepID=A0A151AA04_9EURY|nr:aminopeptidase [Halalkalicoccus paucihalophilus]KYH24449.1 thermophilic metalloprotease (M29) [Halalkalicoccus paucihalophilus]